MDVYYWQGTQEVYSPFKQNMDTVQSSFFRLSLEDLQRVSNVYSRPAFAYNRAKQSGNRVKKQHVQQEGGWSNNTWAGSTRTTTFRSPRSSHEFSYRNTLHKDNTKLPLKKDLYPHPPGPLMALPPGEKVSPLSPSFSPRTHTSSNSSTEFSISVSPRFNWRHLEQQVGGVSEQQLLTQLTQLHLAVNKSNLSCIRQLAADGLDLGIPLRGVTALSCSVQLGKVDVMKEILREMLISRTVQRSINIPSVDSVSRRETPLITAARTGHLDCARILCNYGADLEARDGEGHTALWSAVREQKYDMVNYLINKGAKVYYENNDVSCPLQLACKIPLLKESGKEIASLLVTHGANLEYRDRALRNTLFWVVYNNSRDLAYHIIQSGARIQPWSWVEKEYLPQQIRQDRLLTDLIDSSSSQPQKLVLITICRIRYILSRSVGGKSILKRIEELPVGLEIKKILRLESATSRRKEDIKKLHRLCSETQV